MVKEDDHLTVDSWLYRMLTDKNYEWRTCVNWNNFSAFFIFLSRVSDGFVKKTFSIFRNIILKFKMAIDEDKKATLPFEV